MKQIRMGVFETNSSSVHSLTIVTADDCRKWGDGELSFDRWERKLVAVPVDDDRFLSREQYYDYVRERCFDEFYEKFTTPSGDEMVAFGYSGYNG